FLVVSDKNSLHCYSRAPEAGTRLRSCATRSSRQVAAFRKTAFVWRLRTSNSSPVRSFAVSTSNGRSSSRGTTLTRSMNCNPVNSLHKIRGGFGGDQVRHLIHDGNNEHWNTRGFRSPAQLAQRIPPISSRREEIQGDGIRTQIFRLAKRLIRTVGDFRSIAPG